MATSQPNDNATLQSTGPSFTTKKVDFLGTSWLLALALVAVTFLAYAPVWHAGFVWDDETLITENRLIKASDGLYRFWFTTEPDDYWPLTSTAWWLEWRLWGASPMGYHVVNVLLHAVNTVLVWMVLRRLKIPGAWLAALVFAIHPVNVATVAWVSEQKNTLSMLFYATAILFYLRFAEEDRWCWYGFALAAFLLALLSKTAVVMLPMVLLGCVWWLHGRMRWKDFLSSVPFFILSAALGLVTIRFQYHHRIAVELAAQSISLASRFATAGSVPWLYLYKAALPLGLTAVYPKWQPDSSRWISYVPGIIFTGGLALFWWKRNRWGRPLLFGFGYFVVMLLPVLGFFDQSFHRLSSVADHWQYYSIIAPIALLVAAGEWVGRRLGERGRRWGAVLGTAVLMVLGVATWTRASVYANSETLWRDNVAKNPDAWVAHYNLATDLQKAGKLQEAGEQYEQTLRLRPGYAEAENNLGITLALAGRVQEAVMHFERALQIDPNLADVHGNLGHALMLLGDESKAIEHWQRALQINPDNAEVHYDLGLALEQAGKFEDAIEHYEQALRLKPDYVDARASLQLARQTIKRLQSHGTSGQR
jgi:Flp pilus assembly protein TadD